ncbi:hypothetical protein BKA57DRAFT_153842 [Linnemannia elongata]|nr:hypothetical protein BKA57DRAFT_153842 [Linnemannia elongata]
MGWDGHMLSLSCLCVCCSLSSRDSVQFNPFVVILSIEYPILACSCLFSLLPTHCPFIPSSCPVSCNPLIPPFSFLSSPPLHAVLSHKEMSESVFPFSCFFFPSTKTYARSMTPFSFGHLYVALTITQLDPFALHSNNTTTNQPRLLSFSFTTTTLNTHK